MSRYVKDLLTREIKSRYASMDSAIWIEMMGVDGITTNSFRRQLHSKKMSAEVVKNSIFRRACETGPFKTLAESLDGPAMLLTGGDSVMEIAKLLDEWQPKMPTLKIKGAVLEGEFLDEKTAKGLAKMPSKRDLQARVAACILAPGGKLSAAINAPAANIAGCLKALIDKLEKNPPAEAAAPAA